MREVLPRKHPKNSNELLRKVIDRHLKVLRKAVNNTKATLVTSMGEYLREDRPVKQIDTPRIQTEVKQPDLPPKTDATKQPTDLEIIRRNIARVYNQSRESISGDAMPEWYSQELGSKPNLDNPKKGEKIEPTGYVMDYEEELTDDVA